MSWCLCFNLSFKVNMIYKFIYNILLKRNNVINNWKYVKRLFFHWFTLSLRPPVSRLNLIYNCICNFLKTQIIRQLWSMISSSLYAISIWWTNLPTELSLCLFHFLPWWFYCCLFNFPMYNPQDNFSNMLLQIVYSFPNILFQSRLSLSFFCVWNACI